MVGKRVDNIEEIRAYINVRSKLGYAKQIYTETEHVFGCYKVSYTTVLRWKKKFASGVESVEMLQNVAGRRPPPDSM